MLAPMVWMAPHDLVEAILARRQQLKLRLAIGAGILAGTGALLGWAFMTAWLAVWYAAQVGEYLAAGGTERAMAAGRRPPLGVAVVLIFLANAVFGALALVALAQPDPWTMACGVCILTGGLLNAAATSRNSRLAFIASAGPHALFTAAMPLIALLRGAAAAQVGGMVAGAILLVTAAMVLRGVGVRALRQAQEASAAKSVFLANMSHEIRTPLNGVLGMAQAMAADDLPQAQRERLRIIQRSGEALLALLNDVLDLSKIEAGKLDLEPGAVDVAQVARDLCESFSALSAAKDIVVSVEVDPSAEGTWRGDPLRIRQIIANLLSNAIKFTERGAVTTDLRHTHGVLQIAVTDTGPGIAPDRMARLFDKFTQADATTTRKFGGTGLGLSICRELAELMGGEIEVTSVVGAGSTFRARLPLERTAERPAEAPAALPAVAPRTRVLAAEDHETNQAVLRILLEQLGLDVRIVGDGLQAVEAWEREPWDLILLDVQMPVMDGPTAAVRIRAREAELGRARVPIVALTGNAMAHHQREYEGCGMDAVVAKPLELGRLVEAMNRVLAAAPAQPATRRARRPGRKRR